MPNGLYDVVLLGFRNDLARARLRAALAAGNVGTEPHREWDDDVDLPHALFTGLPYDRADLLRLELSDLGGQVAVRVAEGPSNLEPKLGSDAPRGSWLPMLLFSAVLAAGAFASWRNAGSPLPNFLLPSPDSRFGRPVPYSNAEVARLNRKAVDLGDAGQFAEAVSALRAALATSPGETVVRRNLQITYYNWGMRELEAGRPAEAGSRFSEGLRLGPQPELKAGLGIAYLRQREHRLAQGYLEEAYGEGVHDAGVLMALAEVYEAQHDRVRALEFTQRARDAGANSPSVNARVNKLAREVDAEWEFTERESRNFVVRFDAAENPSSAQIVLRSLEAAYNSVGKRLGYFPHERTAVVLYADEDFHDITQTPSWAGAAYDGRIKLPVRGVQDDSEELDRVVRHEYAHGVIALATHNRCPAWLNEGIAIWMEEQSPGERYPWALAVVRRNGLFDLADLEAPFARLAGPAAEAAYAQSYLTVQHLVEKYDGRRVPRLLDALGEKGDIRAAIESVYPLTFERLQDEVRASVG